MQKKTGKALKKLTLEADEGGGKWVFSHILSESIIQSKNFSN